MIRPLDVVIMLAGALLVGWLAQAVWLYGPASQLEVLHADGTGHLGLAGHRFVEFAGPLGTTRIEIRDGHVRVASSPCTGKLCIRSGWLRSAGDATACVPNRVSLALLGRDSRFDATTF